MCNHEKSRSVSLANDLANFLFIYVITIQWFHRLGKLPIDCVLLFDHQDCETELIFDCTKTSLDRMKRVKWTVFYNTKENEKLFSFLQLTDEICINSFPCGSDIWQLTIEKAFLPLVFTSNVIYLFLSFVNLCCYFTGVKCCRWNWAMEHASF